MIVRVQSGSLGKPFRMVVANAMILAGSAGVLVWAWGMLETALYQQVQESQFERQLVGHPGNAEPSLPARPALTETGERLRTRVALENPAALSGLFGRDPFVLGEIK